MADLEALEPLSVLNGEEARRGLAARRNNHPPGKVKRRETLRTEKKLVDDAVRSGPSRADFMYCFV